MTFQKLRFKEIVNGDDIQYFINNENVDKNTYDKISEDESLYSLPTLPKTNGIPDDKCNNKSPSEECMCDGCQQLRQIVSDIQEMDFDEAVDALRDFLEVIKTEATLSTIANVYHAIGNEAIKNASRIEVQLENYFDELEEDD